VTVISVDCGLCGVDNSAGQSGIEPVLPPAAARQIFSERDLSLDLYSSKGLKWGFRAGDRIPPRRRCRSRALLSPDDDHLGPGASASRGTRRIKSHPSEQAWS